MLSCAIKMSQIMILGHYQSVSNYDFACNLSWKKWATL